MFCICGYDWLLSIIKTEINTILVKLRQLINYEAILLFSSGPLNDFDFFLFFLSINHIFFDVSLFSHINEDKRKTEGQKQIFDVVYEVDGCPVSLKIAAVYLCVIATLILVQIVY